MIEAFKSTDGVLFEKYEDFVNNQRNVNIVNTITSDTRMMADFEGTFCCSADGKIAKDIIWFMSRYLEKLNKNINDNIKEMGTK